MRGRKRYESRGETINQPISLYSYSANSQSGMSVNLEQNRARWWCLVQLKRRLHDCVRLLWHKVMMTFVETVLFEFQATECFWWMFNTRTSEYYETPTMRSGTGHQLTVKPAEAWLCSSSPPSLLPSSCGWCSDRQIRQIYCISSWMSHINGRR